LIDPPWKIRVETDYDLLSDEQLLAHLPLNNLLNKDGLLFCWVVNQKISFTIKWLERLGFELVDTIAWVKLSKA